eukprot:CAMPEP_0113867432 /NCGR_PEP_ID=MMETSP0780_2-20120614/413_1 /TAXON_ID=652834 /ORGANISM="Palpitomonas bilix" /LENGTH=347 /DNA_ID=CAMNT_0000852369 /DNA_START=51 /DNA_END=1094 /DNA_ORIENTATION=- /assembly_acc=CAM_ASM_000599
MKRRAASAGVSRPRPPSFLPSSSPHVEEGERGRGGTVEDMESRYAQYTPGMFDKSEREGEAGQANSVFDDELNVAFVRTQRNQRALKEGKGELRYLERELIAAENKKMKKQRQMLARDHIENLNFVKKTLAVDHNADPHMAEQRGERNTPQSGTTTTASSPYYMIGAGGQAVHTSPHYTPASSTSPLVGGSGRGGGIGGLTSLASPSPSIGGSHKAVDRLKPVKRTPRSFLRAPSADAVLDVSMSADLSDDVDAVESPVYHDEIILEGEKRKKEEKRREMAARREALAVAAAPSKQWGIGERDPVAKKRGGVRGDVLGGVMAFLNGGGGGGGRNTTKSGRPKSSTFR